MKKHLLAGAFVLAVMVLCSTAPAHAQGVDIFAGYSFSTNNQNFGLAGEEVTCEFIDFCEGFGNSGSFNSGGLHGYNVAAVFNLNKHIGIEANFAGHNGSNDVYKEVESSTTFKATQTTDSYLIVFGPKFTQQVGNVELFGHALVGINSVHAGFHLNQNECDEEEDDCSIGGHGTGFATVVGGGVDWWHGRWGLRLLEVDFTHGDPSITFQPADEPNFNFTSPSSSNNISLSAGLIFHLGGMKK